MFFVIGDIFAGALIGVVTTLEVRAFIDPRRDMRILENKSDAGVASSSEVHFQQKISNPVRVVEIFAVHNAPATYADAAPVRTQHPTSSEAQSGQQYYVLRPDLTSAARRQAVNYCITVVAWGACTALLVVGCSRHPKTAATPTYSQAQLAEWGSPPDLDTIPPGPTGIACGLAGTFSMRRRNMPPPMWAISSTAMTATSRAARCRKHLLWLACQASFLFTRSVPSG